MLYAAILAPVVPDAAGNLMTASLISAPAAIAVSALLVPDVDKGKSDETAALTGNFNSSIDAVVGGTFDGVKLVVSVAATLVVAVALVSLVNQLFGLLPAVGGEALSLQRMLGWAMAPVAWLLGIPWSEAHLAGELMGTKIVLNELIAYLNLAALPADGLSSHSRLILTCALCGFANLGSMGIPPRGLRDHGPGAASGHLRAGSQVAACRQSRLFSDRSRRCACRVKGNAIKLSVTGGKRRKNYESRESICADS